MEKRIMLYFTADTHFSHFNILKYCQRPFPSVEVMNNILISNILETVKPEDTLYILGDFAFKQEDFLHYRDILERACQLVFCKGNHDPKALNYQLMTDFKHNKRHYYCLHYPLYAWRPNTVILSGHSHGNPREYPEDSRQQWAFDVGVDVNWYGRKYYPVGIDQIERAIEEGIHPTK